MYYAYLLENLGDKSWYIGSTSDLKRRIQEHQTGSGGRTTRIKKNWHLIYYEAYLDKRDAVGREKFLKSGSGRKYLKKQLRNYLLDPARYRVRPES
ncbi:GIY-YIG nuclease family protein [Patescibacteria group bacterium]|nr:GIY-YIG nuclease family protein [Patescibacteria group bacterium]MBU4458472.1 GIY-YIG nuclease family protein [Patescibacteria group bacterium]MCG2696325.1 GIY-YIG nuclease family protein [Candidatus Portnoybacteria bacterium]